MPPRPWRYQIFAVVMSLISGTLFAIALPPSDLGLLAWIAFLPLLIAARITRPALAGLCGLLAALATVGALTYPWATPAQCANAFFLFSGIGFALGITAATSSFTSKKLSPGAWALFVSCTAVAVELFSKSILPFNAAISQHQSAGMLRIASYTGIWGASFLLWLFPAMLIAMFLRSKSACFAFGIVLAVLISAAIPFSHSQDKTLSVAAIQASDGMSAAEETAKAAGKAKVAVWPELLLDDRDTDPREAAIKNHIYIVSSYMEQPKDGKPFNAAQLISPEGRPIGSVRKRHLFGREVFDFQKGSWSRVMKADGFRVGIEICYDTMFGDVTRHLAREGAEVVFVPNGDPETPRSMFNHLHAAATAFRAAENGTPIVLADGDSLSSIFDSDGKLIVRAPERKTSWVSAKVHLRKGKTLYTLGGDYFAYMCSGLALIYLIASVRNRQRKIT